MPGVDVLPVLKVKDLTAFVNGKSGTLYATRDRSQLYFQLPDGRVFQLDVQQSLINERGDGAVNALNLFPVLIDTLPVAFRVDINDKVATIDGTRYNRENGLFELDLRKITIEL